MNETYIWYLRMSSINKSQHIDFCGKCLENVYSLQRRVREEWSQDKMIVVSFRQCLVP